MTNKTRKHIGAGTLVMAVAVIGILAAFLVLANNPGVTMAQSPPPVDPCAGMTEAERGAFLLPGGTTCGVPGTGTGGNGNGGTTGAAVHATMPQDYWLQGLDNGARLDWDAPYMLATGATVVGYRIDRDAWNANSDHPVNMYGGATINRHTATPTHHSDLGLAYETAYTYKVQAIVEYDVEHWWNNLNCQMMNDVVSPAAGEPAVGPDTTGTAPYCVMYDDLSDAAKKVVNRAYDGLDGMYPDENSYVRYALGAWSASRTIDTADSGGRLMALLDPPGVVRSIGADPACDDMITVRWQAPSSWGTVPAADRNGVYVGPDYIGADDAGREEVGEDAAPGNYQVQRMVNDGRWASVTPDGRTYPDSNVDYDNTYKYRVRAMNSHGLYGPWAMVMEDLTEPPEPQTPRSLNVDPIAANTVELEWLAPLDTATPLLWRTQADFNHPGDGSRNLQYVIERQVGTTGSWDKIAKLYHQYGESLRDHRTQGYTDNTAPAGNVNYRVAALVNNCNPSAYSQKDEIVVMAAPLTLGAPSAVAATSGSAGAITVSYTAGANASGHLIILAQGTTLVDFAVKIDGSDASFSNVAAGDYRAIVVSFRRMDGTLESKHDLDTVTVN